MIRTWGIVMFGVGLVITLTATTLLVFSNTLKPPNGYLTIFGIIGIGLMVLSTNILAVVTQKKKE